MDTFTTLVAASTLAFIYFGERFKAGVYLWLAMLFSILFALRMGEYIFYVTSAGLIGVLVYRVFYPREDVRNSNDSERSD